MLAKSDTDNNWLVDASFVASLSTWRDPQGRQIDLWFEGICNPTRVAQAGAQTQPHLSQVPKTPPPGSPPAQHQEDQSGLMQKMFALLTTNCDNQHHLMSKLEETKTTNLTLMNAVNTKVSGLESMVDNQAWQLEQQKGQVDQLRAEQSEHVDIIQNLQASNEVVTDEMVQMKERLYQLEHQLASSGANGATQVHYHDNRTVVVVINGIGKYHVEEATDALPVLWYNFHGHDTGATSRRVFLPPQTPRQHPVSGEWMVDLVEHAGQKKAVFEGIYTKYLTFAPQAAKRRRRF